MKRKEFYSVAYVTVKNEDIVVAFNNNVLLNNFDDVNKFIINEAKEASQNSLVAQSSIGPVDYRIAVGLLKQRMFLQCVIDDPLESLLALRKTMRNGIKTYTVPISVTMLVSNDM